MKKAISMVLAAVMTAAMFTGCGAGSTAQEQDPNAIRIGMSAPLTGGAAVYGTAVEAGMQIAVDEINAKGGLQIAFQPQDDEHDGEKAVAAYNGLKDWNMQMLAGCITTGPCLAVAPMAAADGMFMMTPSGSAVDIAMAGPTVFQMCFSDPDQGAGAAIVMAEHDMAEAVGIIYDSSDDYSTGLVTGFKAKAKELGINIVCETSFTNENKTDLSTQVTQCKDAGADLVFLPFYATEAAQALTFASKIGYEPQFFGCDGMDGILAVEGFDKSLAENLVLMTPFSANGTEENVVSFVGKFHEKMNGLDPNQFAADGYDVIYALYNACVELGIDGTVPAEEVSAKLVEYFRTYEFSGLTGKNMTWNENGMISKVPTVVVVRDGVYAPMQ